MTDLVTAAQAVLRDNDRGGYTVPTTGLYPYQWNWDAAFCALGWITFDEPRAWRELTRLLEGQWADGMVPHIVFHAPSDTYFPGPDVWQTPHVPATSGITQPAVLASAARLCWERARDKTLAEDQLAALYPRILRWHRWWVEARDPDRIGLVGMLHPWESGMDNSPAWDDALARVSPTPTSAIRRKDVGHIDADMRPSDDFYKRVIALIDLYASLDWQPQRMWAQTPFRIADVGLNAILHRANRDLLGLARRFGTRTEQLEIAARLDITAAAIDRLWSAAAGIYQAQDLISGERIDVATSAGLLPLWAGVADAGKLRALSVTLERWAKRTRFLVPSTAPEDGRFEPRRYWRGPIWGMMNMMIGEGLAEAGARELARRIKVDTAHLMNKGGFREYFDPLTGDGLGGGHFSWTAAIALYWNLHDEACAEAPAG
jgi:glycogen debranching enzyme